MAKNGKLKALSAKQIADQAEKQAEVSVELIQQIADSMPAKLGNETERKMMAVKMIPGSHNLSITERCRIAGIDRTMWYYNLGKPKFNERCIEATKRFKGQYTPEVFTAFIENAISGDSKAQIDYLREVGFFPKPEKGAPRPDSPTQIVNVAVQNGEADVSQSTIEGAIKGLEKLGYRIIRPANNRLGELVSS